MNKEMYKDIIGITDFFHYFPNVYWCYFHEILEFRWYREFDYEEWCDQFCVDLKMSDIEKKDIILLTLKGVSCDGSCEFLGWISGLDIINLKYTGTGYELQYEVLDFEDSHIHFYCDEIVIKVISVNGKEIEKLQK
ncbi:MAG: hypothetical protein K2N51_14315 [Lachnospiraceae bacterium]|nr:hypothetical protein [Lachnospiraceae bacterium]